MPVHYASVVFAARSTGSVRARTACTAAALAILAALLQPGRAGAACSRTERECLKQVVAETLAPILKEKGATPCEKGLGVDITLVTHAAVVCSGDDGRELWRLDASDIPANAPVLMYRACTGSANRCDPRMFFKVKGVTGFENRSTTEILFDRGPSDSLNGQEAREAMAAAFGRFLPAP
ncbi:MAG: hypothetical protein HY078_02880 [Elusimicrobia bacterium]|nr:hypothetical protein [Elusimicrobiota bacterium]